MSNRVWLVGAILLAQGAAAAETPLAFPGATGAAATTPGGRGGEIVRVTTLAAFRPGVVPRSRQKAGRRTVVFEVGGTIDLAESTVRITEPYLTIAGQTAPPPGITLIRGGIDITTHNVIVRHIRVRPGDGGRARLPAATMTRSPRSAAHDVIVDHCSLTWAIDENLSASGPRFTGNSPEEWRKGTSHRITFSNNIIAEGLADSVHVKGEHSKGSLIHDNVTDILIIGNLYAHDQERSPLFKGGVRGAIVNNLIYDPGQRAIHYNLIAEEWVEAHELAEAIAIARDSLENCRRAPFMRNDFVAAQWLAGFLLLNGDMEGGRTVALEAFPLSRALGNINLMDFVDQLALVVASQGHTAHAARLCGFADAHGRRYSMSRYRISFAVRERLVQRLEALSPDRRAALLAEGAAWSEDGSRRLRS